MGSAAKNTLCAILALFILLSAVLIGHNQDQDADRNSRVDLRDVVLHVKQFAQTAENTGSFEAEIARVLESMLVAAGLKTVILQHSPVKDASFTSGADTVYLRCDTGFECGSLHIGTVVERSNPLKSIPLAPPSPPPRISRIG